MKKNYISRKLSKIHSLLATVLFLTGLLLAGISYGQDTDPFVLGINCGGEDDYTAVDGTVYVADDFFTGGSALSDFTDGENDISNTDDEPLYQTYRRTAYGEGSSFRYDIPLEDGTYKVTLKFASYHKWETNEGDVIIEGNQMLTRFNPKEEVGWRVAIDTTIVAIVDDGELNIEFVTYNQPFYINAILVEEDVPYSLGINCGGEDDYTAVDGTVYVADDFFTGGSALSDFTDGENDISNTDDEPLYQTYRRTAYGEGSSFRYDIPLEDGTYKVTLKFASYHKWETNEGDVIIEGNQMLTRFNPKEEVGWRVAIDTTVVAIVDDGELNIEFVTYNQPFYVNAILIEEVAEQYFTLVGNVENGTIIMEPDGGSYTSGTEVTVTVEPDYGFYLQEWTGDIEGVDDPTATTITVLMDKNKSITAVLDQYTMYTFEKIAENGKIIVEPEERDSYISGTELTLTAEPDYGYSFKEWTGDLEGVDVHTATTINVLMDKDRSITAVFEENPMFKLTTNVENGIIYLNPQPDADGGMYYEGATVRLTAQPHVGYVFTGWSGDLSGDENPTTIVMDKDLDITAEMSLNVFPLTIEATNGTVTTLPISGDEFAAGTQLVLQAIPDDGYRFVRWDGDISGSNNPTSITINAAMHIIAVFKTEPSVADIIEESPDHAILAGAVADADLVDALSAEGPFTVFAPTDAAFNALPDGLLDGLSSEELKDILLYHVVEALALSTDLEDGDEITTMLGEDVVVTITNGTVFINDAEVIVANLEAVNGVVHVIDAVLIPVEELSVTFNVDMSTAEGFDPDTDVVYMTGDLLGWAEPGNQPDDQTMTRVDDSMIWTKTLALEEGTYQYKYFINAGWDGGEWDGDPNREVVVTEDMVVDNVWRDLVNVNDLEATQINIFPNPARDNFKITAAGSVIRSIVVTDITGKVVYNDIINDTQKSIHNAFQSGIYIVRIHTDEGVFVRKLQIQK